MSGTVQPDKTLASCIYGPRVVSHPSDIMKPSIVCPPLTQRVTSCAFNFVIALLTPVLQCTGTGDWDIFVVVAVVRYPSNEGTVGKTFLWSHAFQFLHPDNAFARTVLCTQRLTGVSVQYNIQAKCICIQQCWKVVKIKVGEFRNSNTFDVTCNLLQCVVIYFVISNSNTVYVYIHFFSNSVIICHIIAVD